jgi:hypothetical protein
MAVTLGDCKVLGRANKYVAAGMLLTPTMKNLTAKLSMSLFF